MRVVFYVYLRKYITETSRSVSAYCLRFLNDIDLVVFVWFLRLDLGNSKFLCY